MHWEHDINEEGDGGDEGGTMVQEKGELWGFAGNLNVCPLKPIQWLQRADAFPYTQKWEGLCVLTWGG
eukprot:11240912-Ditylum_brightwellii.AAC.1